VLELSKVTEHHGWVRASDIPQLTPRLARDYAARTIKTLSRDLNTVEEMNLVLRVGQTVRANKHIILAFLPARASRVMQADQAQSR